jgi:hypothetical protein
MPAGPIVILEAVVGLLTADAPQARAPTMHGPASAEPPPTGPAPPPPLRLLHRRYLGSSVADGNAAPWSRLCDRHAHDAKAEGEQSRENRFIHLLLHILLAKLLDNRCALEECEPVV